MKQLNSRSNSSTLQFFSCTIVAKGDKDLEQGLILTNIHVHFYFRFCFQRRHLLWVSMLLPERYVTLLNLFSLLTLWCVLFTSEVWFPSSVVAYYDLLVSVFPHSTLCQRGSLSQWSVTRGVLLAIHKNSTFIISIFSFLLLWRVILSEVLNELISPPR